MTRSVCSTIGTLIAAIACIAAPGAAHAKDEPYPFVVDGKRKQTVIVPAESLSRKEMSAARDLAKYLETITGCRVPVGRSPSNTREIRIHVGRTDFVNQLDLGLENIHHDGYAIKLVDQDNLVIVGGRNLGTGFGIYDFLKRWCGVRWFMPGPLGEVVPKKEAIVLDGLDLRGEPSVESVWIRPIHIDNLKVKHFRRYHWAGHNLKRLIPPRKCGATHPEYYPLVMGERRVPLGRRFPWQPCVSTPQLAGHVADAARKHFAKTPYSKVFSMGVNDGGGDCLCDQCQALDIVQDGVRSMSDRYACFYDRCAATFEKTFPDKLLGVSAYGGMWHPPRRYAFRDNTYLRLCGRPNMLEALDAWSQKVPHLGVYDYVYGTLILEPRHYPHVLGEYVKMLVKKHHILSFSAEVFPFWPFDGPKCYVLSELLWDIDQDIDALLDEYFTGLYGESAGPMKRFFQRMEDVYRRRDDPHYFFDGFRRGGFSGWELADLEYLAAKLGESRRTARDETVKARIQEVDDAYQHIQCWLRIHVYTTKLQTMTVRSRRDAAQVVAYAKAIFRSIAELRKWDQNVLDRARYPSDEHYKFYVAHHYAKPGALVGTIPRAEDAIEAAFEQISRLPIGDVGAFWRRVAKEDGGATRLTLLASTLEHGSDVDTIMHDDFEDVGRTQQPIADALLEQYRWRRRESLPKDYGVWSYLGRPARFVCTDKLSRTGARCVGIESNEVKASINRPLPVKPGERYRVSVFATRVWQDERGDTSASLTVAWQSERGWSSAPRLTKAASHDRSGVWEELVVRVTVPGDAARMVVMMGTSGSRLGGGGTYFDDLRIERTLGQN